MVNDERTLFEQVGRQVFRRAVREAQEKVTREDVTLGPDPTAVSVEVGGEKFILGVQGAAEGEPSAERVCCYLVLDCGGDDCMWIGYGPCCATVLAS